MMEVTEKDCLAVRYRYTVVWVGGRGAGRGVDATRK